MEGRPDRRHGTNRQPAPRAARPTSLFDAAASRDNLLHGLLVDAPAAILLVDGRRTILRANSAAFALFNASAEDLLAQPLDAWLAAPRDGWEVMWRTLLAVGHARHEHHVTHPREARLVEGRYRTHVAGECHLCIIHDLTVPRLLADQLAHAARIESVGRLAGGIAHDFNNLLTAILMYTDLLLSTQAIDAPEREPLAQIQRAGERAAALTRQLLAVGRPHTLRPQFCDVNHHVNALAPLLQRVVRADVVLTIETAGRPALVPLDPHEFEQAVLNLVLNARDALPMGGRIEIDVSHVTVAAIDKPPEAAGPAGPWVRLRVMDNGSGIPPEIRAHLFEPFFTTKAVGKGTGLGLASVHGIVSHGGGFMTVASPPNGRTIFALYLPTVAGPALPVAPEPAVVPNREPGLRRETILVVEDEEGLRAVISALLRRDGYRVIALASPTAAEETVARRPEAIDLLVTDLVMPDMNGPALAQRCVAAKPTLRVLFLSGAADVRAAAVLPGPFVGFLSKPFRAGALIDAVREMLDRPSPVPSTA